MNPQLSTRKEISTHFKVTPRTVQNWEKSGVIKRYCTISNRPRYELKTIIEKIKKEGGL